MYMPGVCRLQHSIKSPDNRFIDGCKPPCKCWESDLDPVKEHLPPQVALLFSLAFIVLYEDGK